MSFWRQKAFCHHRYEIRALKIITQIEQCRTRIPFQPKYKAKLKKKEIVAHAVYSRTVESQSIN